MMRILSNNAHNIIEYALVISVISLVLVSMSGYLQRGIQGVAKVTADGLALPAGGVEEGIKEAATFEYKAVDPQSINIKESTVGFAYTIPSMGSESPIISSKKVEKTAKGTWKTKSSISAAGSFDASEMQKIVMSTLNLESYPGSPSIRPTFEDIVGGIGQEDLGVVNTRGSE